MNLELKKIFKIAIGIVLVIVLGIFAFSGKTINPGEEGFLFDSFGDGINKEMVYTEGYVWFLPWKEMIVYNVQNKSHKYTAKLLDKEGTDITVSVTVNASPMKGKTPFIHLKHGIGYKESIIDVKSSGAIKDAVGKYNYEEIYGKMREKVESEIEENIRKELTKENISIAFVEVTDVDLPPAIASAIVEKQTQDQLNLKAEKMKQYETNIASAAIEAARGRFETAEYDAKTKAILSQPKMLELKRLEIDQIWAEKGISPWGSNNVFGVNPTLFKELGNKK